MEKLSNCCQAEVTIGGIDGSTKYYVCLDCKEPCDLEEGDEKQHEHVDEKYD